MATSSAVKNKWNSQHYKKIQVSIDKDLVEQWENVIKEQGISKADFFRNAIKKFLNNN